MTAYDPARFVAFDEAELRRIVSPDARVEKLAGGFGFIEGPVWSSAGGGSLIFSDIPRNELKRWTPAGGVTTYRTPSGNANGNTRDREGRLITCEHSGRRVSIESREGRVETLVDAYQGRRLNSPNDVVVKSDGSVWFTDPPTASASAPRTRSRSTTTSSASTPAAATLRSVVGRLPPPQRPLLLPGRAPPLHRRLRHPHHVRVFDVGEDGALTGGQVFCTIGPGIPDGMRCDTEGRLYSSAGDGIHVFTTAGDLIGKIITPDAPGRFDPSRIGPEVPANLCFGGPDGTTLYITACTSLYTLPLLTRGAVLH